MALSKFGQRPLIALAGLLGAGKSVFAEKLGAKFGLPVFLEPTTDNEYLDDFYAEGGKAMYGFEMQIYLMYKRFRQQQAAIWSEDGAIMDRSAYEDDIFCRTLVEEGHIDERAYQTFRGMSDALFSFLKNPTLIIFLDVSVETSLERIMQRSRACEIKVDPDEMRAYLTKLHAGYQTFIDEISKHISVIRVRWDNFRDIDETVDLIAETYEGMRSLETVEL